MARQEEGTIEVNEQDCIAFTSGHCSTMSPQLIRWELNAIAWVNAYWRDRRSAASLVRVVVALCGHVASGRRLADGTQYADVTFGQLANDLGMESGRGSTSAVSNWIGCLCLECQPRQSGYRSAERLKQDGVAPLLSIERRATGRGTSWRFRLVGIEPFVPLG